MDEAAMEVLGRLGVDISPDTLVGVVTAAAADDRGREILANLPVAAATGSLFDRFQDPSAAGGRGWVHAKTGTLAGVGALTGYTVTTSGQLVAFSLMINGGQGETNQRNELDRVATAITTAGC
jgi:D-alanyl-D-alanine carboxypeptidase/D-alanyl-D-alanine-endopeptidase (penicillin-binding protein 4)